MGFRFADCELWPAQRLLLCRGRALAIGGRAFDLLHALVENSHRLMEKNELLERVWPGLAVEPNNLQVQVWTLRRLLGHGAIATVARRGFRFMLPVLPAIPGAPGLQRVPAPSLAPAGQDRPDLRDAGPGLPVAWRDWAAPLIGLPMLTLVGSDPAALRAQAEALAAHRRGSRPAGLWRIEARTLGSGPRVHALPGPDDALWRQLARQAGQLLVLDCQHAMAAARAVVQACRVAAPELQLLATAARPLGMAGEVLAKLPDDGPAPGSAAPSGGLRWRPRPDGGHG